ncbi:MAG: hypothetical protein A3C71_00840 [Candidatus Yanofskybacteria bacterium RIFCSPHIGHO2_02_FULL_43_15c]|uniref:Uncharacterized protein n=1 Tax=Candidatus Yanofskybacteria bacterium RIFCSPHIGHO2_02_FULL_43_15c TaxID=1802679 RepID=A0A1F8FES0_9BACT|nr:MAG: hypothetical protein A3C71_00840 [Candidatus Yanofskybacteria bacterium RIFCSPHIGHO2_02_FULL_43_15c]
MFSLEIVFEKTNSISLVIKRGTRTIDRAGLSFERNLEQVLIVGLDKILNKNRMSLLSLKRVRITGKVRKDSLSYQIAQAFKKALG